MLTTSINELADFYSELKPLLNIHYKELSEHGKRGYPISYNVADYFKYENDGQLLCVTLREEGQLIGYFIGFITLCLHYKLPTLTGDMFYVLPDKRGKKGGYLLMQEIKDEVKRRNIKVWKMGYKEEHREFMEKLLLACGFSPFERMLAYWAED